MNVELTPQFIQGQEAYLTGKPRTANPFNYDKAPAYFGRWLNGYSDAEKMLNDPNYSYDLDHDDIY